MTKYIASGQVIGFSKNSLKLIVTDSTGQWTGKVDLVSEKFIEHLRTALKSKSVVALGLKNANVEIIIHE